MVSLPVQGKMPGEGKEKAANYGMLGFIRLIHDGLW
jgi:hypothetical protein